MDSGLLCSHDGFMKKSRVAVPPSAFFSLHIWFRIASSNYYKGVTFLTECPNCGRIDTYIAFQIKRNLVSLS